MVEYVTVKIPITIVRELIDPHIKSGHYFSRADVVKGALRAFVKVEA
jgi:Arc/MetJ-type ribon-helix-helix transcriptional regulator